MELAEKYRELAQQCRTQAIMEPRETLRALHLELAEYWESIADEQEQVARKTSR